MNNKSESICNTTRMRFNYYHHPSLFFSKIGRSILTLIRPPPHICRRFHGSTWANIILAVFTPLSEWVWNASTAIGDWLGACWSRCENMVPMKYTCSECYNIRSGLYYIGCWILFIELINPNPYSILRDSVWDKAPRPNSQCPFLHGIREIQEFPSFNMVFGFKKSNFLCYIAINHHQTAHLTSAQKKIQNPPDRFYP